MKQKSKKVLIWLGLMSAITGVNLAVTLYSQEPQKREAGVAGTSLQRSQLIEEVRSRFPVADFEPLEVADPLKSATRRDRGERHNKSLLAVKGGMTAPPASGSIIVLTTDWEVSVERIPARQSDVVVVGEILDANAFVSTDKTGVYSEFTFRVEEIIKKDSLLQARPGESITVERQGGRVRYPSGRIEWYSIASQRVPLPDRRYVLFLKRVDAESFSIITGYELREGKVSALDADASKFRFYNGVDESSFLEEVRRATQSTPSGNTL